MRQHLSEQRLTLKFEALKKRDFGAAQILRGKFAGKIGWYFKVGREGVAMINTRAGVLSVPHSDATKLVSPSDIDNARLFVPRQHKTAPPNKRTTWERVTLYLPPDVAKALRHHVVDVGGDMSDVAAEALRIFLE